MSRPDPLCVRPRPAAALRSFSPSSSRMLAHGRLCLQDDVLLVTGWTGRTRTVPVADIAVLENQWLPVGTNNATVKAAQFVLRDRHGRVRAALPGGWAGAGPVDVDGKRTLPGWWNYDSVRQFCRDAGIELRETRQFAPSYSYARFGTLYDHPLPPPAYRWATSWLVLGGWLSGALALVGSYFLLLR